MEGRVSFSGLKENRREREAGGTAGTPGESSPARSGGTGAGALLTRAVAALGGVECFEGAKRP